MPHTKTWGVYADPNQNDFRTYVEPKPILRLTEKHARELWEELNGCFAHEYNRNMVPRSELEAEQKRADERLATEQKRHDRIVDMIIQGK